MEVEIKHLDVGSVVKVAFVLYVVIGLVVGVIYMLVSVILGGLLDYGYGPHEAWMGRTLAAGLGILLVPLLALLYGCLGAVGGLILALLYNVIAKTIGGVKVRFQGEITGTGSTGKI
jgi:hypothetical protein